MKKNYSRFVTVLLPIVIIGVLLYPTIRYSYLEQQKHEIEMGKDTAAIAQFNRDYAQDILSAKNKSIKLGLDLRGGMYVMLEVDIVKLLEESAIKETVDETFTEVIDKTRKESDNSDEAVLDIFLRNFESIAKPKAKSLISYFDTGDSREISEEKIVERLKRDIDDAINQAKEVIRQRIDKYGLTEPSIQKQGTRRIVLELPGVKNEQEMRQLLSTTARLEFKLVRNNQDIVRAMHQIDKLLAERMKKSKPKTSTEQLANQSVATPDSALAKSDSSKVDSAKTDSAKVAAAAADTTNPYAGLSQEQQAKAYLEDHPFTTLFSIAFKNGNNYVDALQYGFFLKGNIPDGEYNFIASRSSFDKAVKYLEDPAIRRLVPADLELMRSAKPLNEKEVSADPAYYVYCLKKDAELTGDVLENVSPSFSPLDGTPTVSMQMNLDGAERWSVVTGANVDKQIAIVLDDQVFSAPVVRGKIPNGQSEISGIDGVEEQSLLINVLKAGALKAPVKIIEERTIGPSLGADNIQSGINASVLAVALVILFMMVYYAKGGAIANVAVVINVGLILAILAAFGGTLTLPGIGGVILTIGMAVDANILIFERIREELSKGRAMKSAIDEGFSKALSAILDSNITTFMTGVILYYMGTGPIQGFALTLMIGIITTLFTAIVLSKALIRLTTPEHGHYNFGQPKIQNA